MSKEEIKEEFLKSYNCSSMKEFKHTKLTSEKFYEIMEDYFTKCSYNQKYKEVIDKINDHIRTCCNMDSKFTNLHYDYAQNEMSADQVDELLDILKEVK